MENPIQYVEEKFTQAEDKFKRMIEIAKLDVRIAICQDAIEGLKTQLTGLQDEKAKLN